MQRVQELSPIELVEMFVTVFCFLKDSSEVAQTLLDDFRACHGYVFLTDFLLRCVFLTDFLLRCVFLTDFLLMCVFLTDFLLRRVFLTYLRR